MGSWRKDQWRSKPIEFQSCFRRPRLRVCCHKGRGYLHENMLNIAHQRATDNVVSHRLRHFKNHSVGIVNSVDGDIATVWLIGTDQVWDVPSNEIDEMDVVETGDKKFHKICNICHCLLPVEDFARNQTNLHGIIRRPSCRQYRTDIDKRALKASQARRM